MDTLTVTPIEDNNNLLNTINSHIKLRKLKEVMPLCRTIKSLSIPIQFYPNELPKQPSLSKKRVREADALKQVGANVREEGNKNRSSLYYSNSNSDTATEKTRIKARARLIERQRLELEAQLRKASEEEDDDYCLDSSPDIDPKDDSEDEEERLKALLNAKYNERQSLRKSKDGNRILHSRRNKRTMKLPARWGGYCDSTLYQLTGAYILYFKELSSNNGRIFASVISITRTQAMVLLAIIGHVYFKN
ncbi:hypothetical protein HBI55_022930 [Parastagonospora nodorum]|nr:hypothetical protein HBI55_022930 [Parastagonospora nodorum]